MSGGAAAKLRIFAESSEADQVTVGEGLTYGDCRELWCSLPTDSTRRLLDKSREGLEVIRGLALHALETSPLAIAHAEVQRGALQRTLQGVLLIYRMLYMVEMDLFHEVTETPHVKQPAPTPVPGAPKASQARLTGTPEGPQGGVPAAEGAYSQPAGEGPGDALGPPAEASTEGQKAVN